MSFSWHGGTASIIMSCDWWQEGGIIPAGTAGSAALHRRFQETYAQMEKHQLLLWLHASAQLGDLRFTLL